MAENTSDHLTFWARLDIQNIHFLGQIRHWSNLKLAKDERNIWIKDFIPSQVQSPELRSIPYITFFTCQGNLLFPQDSLLPLRKAPSFLWTPFEKALPLTLDFNHNLFGVDQEIPVRLISTEEEQSVYAHLVNITEATSFIQSSPSVRLKSLSWVRVGDHHALLMGTPLLPLNGKTYWQTGRFILPTGYTLEFTILRKAIEKKLRSEDDLVWWTDDKNYSFLKSSKLRPLSISSWRQTLDEAYSTDHEIFYPENPG